MEIETYRIKNNKKWQKCKFTILKGRIRDVYTSHEGLQDNLRIIKSTNFKIEDILEADNLYKNFGYNYNIIYSNWKSTEYSIPMKLSSIDIFKLKWSKKDYVLQEKLFLKDIILLILGAILGYFIKS